MTNTYVYRIVKEDPCGYTVKHVKILKDDVPGELTLVGGDVIKTEDMDKRGSSLFTTTGRAKHYLKHKLR